MTDPSETTVWDLLAALSSESYELRMVAPGEFELIEVTTEQTDCSEPSLNGNDWTQTVSTESAEA
jgi:hypothetical protein